MPLRPTNPILHSNLPSYDHVPSQRLPTMRSDFAKDDFTSLNYDISNQPFIWYILPHLLAIYILIATCSSLALFIAGMSAQRERKETKLSQQTSEAFDRPTSKIFDGSSGIIGNWTPVSQGEGEKVSFEQLEWNSLEGIKPRFVDLPQIVRFRANEGGRMVLDTTSVGEKRKVDGEAERVRKRRMS